MTTRSTTHAMGPSIAPGRTPAAARVTSLLALQEAERRRAEALSAAILLVALSALAPLSVDMFLPSLPTMTEEFGAAPSTMQLAVLLFILAFASSQLVYGPLSDRAGRRPALFAGLTLFVLGAGVSLLATTPTMLIAGRVLQGLGGGAGPALAQAIVLDVYGRDRAARVLAYMAIALPLAPAIAPVFGGFLHDFSGWHSVFLTLMALGAVLAIMYNLLLPETNPLARRAARPRTSVLADYRLALSSPTFVAYALVMGLMFGGQLLFISTSAFVLIEELGLSASMYGFSFALVAGGIMTGAALSSRIVVQLRPQRTVLLGAGVASLASGTMAALAWLLGPSLAGVLGPMFFVGVGLGITRPSATAAALIEFPQMAGLASGLLGFSQMLVASSLNIAYGRLFEPSALALATGVSIAMLAGLATVLLLRPGRSADLPPNAHPAASVAPVPTEAAAPTAPDTPSAPPPLEASPPAREDAVAARLEAVRLATPTPGPADAVTTPTAPAEASPDRAPEQPIETTDAVTATTPAAAPVAIAPVEHAGHIEPAPALESSLRATFARRPLGLEGTPPGAARRHHPRAPRVALDPTSPASPSRPSGTDRLTRPAAALLLAAVGLLLTVRALLRLGRGRRLARD